MANVNAQASLLPEGVNRGNRFIARSVVGTALANTDTFSVTVPDGVPKDALPVGRPNVYTLSGDVYTLDPDIAVVTTHDRVLGKTVYTAAGAVAAGAILLQEFIGVG